VAISVTAETLLSYRFIWHTYKLSDYTFHTPNLNGSITTY